MKLNGCKIRDQIISKCEKRILAYNPPTLHVLLIGDNKISKKYIEIKRKKSEDIGITFLLTKFSINTRLEDIKKVIAKSNISTKIDGIIIQLPLPDHLDQTALISEINKEKDVDGLRYCSNLESNFIPPVILAILYSLNETKINLKKNKVVIVGNGFLVGKPLNKYLRKRLNDLVIVNTKTKNKDTIISSADVIISATGSPWLIRKKMIKKDAILIDAGTATMENRLVGDIHPDAYKKSSYYSPVPGGIGPLTVGMLIQNLMKSYNKRIIK